jgi:hypothetical protein
MTVGASPPGQATKPAGKRSPRGAVRRRYRPGADARSFAASHWLTKCEADTKATCEASAMEKKLSGAAQASFVK